MKAQWPSCPAMPYLTDRAPHQMSSWDRQRRPALSACQSPYQYFPQLKEWLHPSGYSHRLLYTLWVIFFLSLQCQCEEQDSVHFFLKLLSIEPSPWKKRKRLMKEKMTHTKKGVRERTPEERAFLKEEESLSTKSLLPWQLKRFQHQPTQVSTFLSYYTRLRPGEMCSSNFLRGFCTWQSGLKSKACCRLESWRTNLRCFCNQFVNWSCHQTLPSPYHTLPFALLRNTNNIFHDVFPDTPLHIK